MRKLGEVLENNFENIFYIGREVRVDIRVKTQEQDLCNNLIYFQPTFQSEYLIIFLRKLEKELGLAV